MKKFIYGVMMLSLCLLTACGSKPGAENHVAENPAVESQSSETENRTTELPAAEQQAAQNPADEPQNRTQIAEPPQQSFSSVRLDGWGSVTFAVFAPLEYPSENPDYGTTMFGDVRLMLLAGDEVLYSFPGETSDNMLSGFTQFQKVISVDFADYNNDDRTDIFLSLEYRDADGVTFRKDRLYVQKEGEKEFFVTPVSADAASAVVDITTLSEEEMIALLNERMTYYRESAYYNEITDYWENVREVRDISCHMMPLYESDSRYLTKEELAYDPPAVIHLAKNEIYARHGYIFRDKDLYNYFMGCIWYMPTTEPADFNEAVLNEYEKENLALLAQLDDL